MDRTGHKRFTHNEISSDVLIETTTEETEESSRNEHFLPSSHSIGTKIEPSTAEKIFSMAVDENDVTASDRTIAKPFSALPADAVQAFNSLQLTEQNSSSKYNVYQRKKEKDTDFKEAAKFVEKKATEGVNTENENAFIKLQGNRKDPSNMEINLKTDSSFRKILFAPSGGVRDKTTGLYAELTRFKSDEADHLLLCFLGTGAAGNKDIQWWNNVLQALSKDGPPEVYLQALKLASELKENLSDEDIRLSVAGHSMGGGIANFVGLGLGIPGYTFNGAALGPGSISYLEAKECLTPDRIAQQHHVRLEKDFASSSKLSKAIGTLRMTDNHRPQQIGNVYEATKDDPGFPADKSRMERHPLSAMTGLMRSQQLNLNSKAKKENMPTATSTPDRTSKVPDSTTGAFSSAIVSNSPYPLTESQSKDPSELEKTDD